MAAKVGGYYGLVFQGSRAVMHGDLPYSTIFNVVVDAVVRHWVTVMAESVKERSGSGRDCRNQNYLFYVDDGMVASSDPRWLQGAFSTPVGMFNRVGM